MVLLAVTGVVSQILELDSCHLPRHMGLAYYRAREKEKKPTNSVVWSLNAQSGVVPAKTRNRSKQVRALLRQIPTTLIKSCEIETIQIHNLAPLKLLEAVCVRTTRNQEITDDQNVEHQTANRFN